MSLDTCSTRSATFNISNFCMRYCCPADSCNEAECRELGEREAFLSSSNSEDSLSFRFYCSGSGSNGKCLGDEFVNDGFNNCGNGCDEDVKKCKIDEFTVS